jgi:hypothetical protein
MASVNTVAPGSAINSSAVILAQNTLVLRSGQEDTAYYRPTEFYRNKSVGIPAENMPTLTFYLFLEPEYSANETTYLPQLDITWQPVVQANTAFAVGPTFVKQGLPLAAPLFLPINTPVFYTVRAGMGTIGINFRVPEVSGDDTFNRIHFIVSAAS